MTLYNMTLKLMGGQKVKIKFDQILVEIGGQIPASEGVLKLMSK